MLSMSLPLLPPPPTSLLPAITPWTPDHSFNASPPNLRRPGQHNHQHGTRPSSVHHVAASKHSLAALVQDEHIIAQRKLAIAMFGYSWLKPAGCTKTMLGRREEELEREESERQLAEVEREERVRAEMEEMERVERLRAQADRMDDGGAPGVEERDLDGDVPDMDAEEEMEGDEEEVEDEEDEGDLDDEIPDADLSFRYDTRIEDDTDEGGEGEGETGITDDVEASHLHSGGRGQNRHSPSRANRGRPSWAESRPWDHDPDAEALANAMLDEDELGEAERDLDDEIPDAAMGAERDLDDDVPEAEDEDEWQHTDTELDLELESSGMVDESAMDISGLGVQTRSQTRRRSSGIVAGNVMSVHTPATAQSGGGGGRMSWLASASARRNLFGRGTVGGGLFGRGRNITPPQGLETPAQGRERRSGRRRVRESLD
jgi:Apc15p protein